MAVAVRVWAVPEASEESRGTSCAANAPVTGLTVAVTWPTGDATTIAARRGSASRSITPETSTTALPSPSGPTQAREAGEVIWIGGAEASRHATTRAEPERPAPSIATARSGFGPLTRARVAVKVALPSPAGVTIAATPLTATVAPSSETVPVTATVSASSTAPVAGALMATTGPPPSVRRSSGSSVVAVAPSAPVQTSSRALSPSAGRGTSAARKVPSASWAANSWNSTGSVPGIGTRTVTAVVLEAWPRRVTAAAATELPADGSSPVRAQPPRSSTNESSRRASLPAASWAITSSTWPPPAETGMSTEGEVALWSAPSRRTIGARGAASASETSTWTVTGRARTSPSASSWPSARTTITGGWRSTVTVTLVLPVRPKPSVAETVRAFWPSARATSRARQEPVESRATAVPATSTVPSAVESGPPSTRPATSIVERFVVAPSEGSRITTWGAPVRANTVTAAVSVRPAASAADATRVVRSSAARGTARAVQVPPSTMVGTPFTVTVTLEPVTVPVTSTEVVARVSPSAGAVIATVGPGERSIEKATLALAVRPRASVTVAASV